MPCLEGEVRKMGMWKCMLSSTLAPGRPNIPAGGTASGAQKPSGSQGDHDGQVHSGCTLCYFLAGWEPGLLLWAAGRTLWPSALLSCLPTVDRSP